MFSGRFRAFAFDMSGFKNGGGILTAVCCLPLFVASG